MAAPINTPSAGEIWHLSIDDLFAPVQERHRLGGDGPFVINLSVSTAPITIPTKTFAGFQDAHVYLIQVTEDARVRYRLRLGPFANEDDADAILEEVRDIYPGALTATAIPADLRTIAAMQAKLDLSRAAAKRAEEKVAEEIAIDLPPAPATLIPTVDEEPMDLEKLLHSAASAAMTPPLKAATAPPPKATVAPPPMATVAPPPMATVAPPPKATVAPPPKATVAPPPKATVAPPPMAPPKAASAPTVSELPLELSPEWAIPVLNSRVEPAKEARPAAAPAPVITKSPATLAIWARTPTAPAPAPPAPIAAMPIPTVPAPMPAVIAPPIVATPIPMAATPIPPAPLAPAAAPAIPMVSAAATSAAPVLTEVVATARKPATVKPAASAPIKRAPPAPAPRAMAPMTRVIPPVVTPPAVTPPVLTPPAATTPVLTSRGVTMPAAAVKPPVAAPAATVKPTVVAAPAIAPPPATAPTKMTPVLTEAMPSSLVPTPALKPWGSGFPTPPVTGSVSVPTPRQVKQLDEPLESLEFTQTVRALTPPELEDETLRWYVIQLALSDQAFDPDAVPNLDIFSEYRLYSVAGVDQGRTVHALRLGFFSEEIAAVAVASYLAAYYEKPTIRRVSVAERQRFMDQRVEARKDVGATGAHAVIEITNELVARYRRTPASSATPESSQTGNRWIPSPR